MMMMMMMIPMYVYKYKWTGSLQLLFDSVVSKVISYGILFSMNVFFK